MLLSDAILKGARLAPAQACGCYYYQQRSGVLAACVLGAAMIGAGALKVEDIGSAPTLVAYRALCNRMPETLQQHVQNPVTKKAAALLTVLVDLNDRQHWSREKIAAWLKECGL